MSYAVLVAAWALYLGIHSGLATERVKNFLAWPPKVFRFVYVLVATVGLLALLFFNAYVPSTLMIERSSATRYLGLLLATTGLLIWRAAFKNYRISEFLGLREEPKIFFQTGILGKVRHPIYSGLILVVLGFVVFDVRWPSLVSAACIFAYLPLGIFWEEKKLVAQFGQEYLEYQKRVPAIIPKWR
jgi:protein-S-isoprenylcysteine O-methyltransferase Ste14